MKGWITTLIVAAIVLFILAPWLGIGTGLGLTTILFTFGVLCILKWFGPTSSLVAGLPLNSKMAMMVGIVVLAFGMFSYGWFATVIPLGSILGHGGTVQVAEPTPTTPSACSRVADGGAIPDDIWGTSSSIIFNAYDMEANQPKSTAVDLSTNCDAFRNGLFAVTTADTSAPTALAGFGVGDKLDVYCGGSSYYTDPILGSCIDSQTDNHEILTHAAATEANTDITCYDKTGATACTSGTSSEDDYTMALSANQEDLIYVQVQDAVANKAIQLCAMGVVKFYNITKVEPQPFTFNGVSYTWAQVPTPLHMQQITVLTNETASTGISRDYVVYKLNSPILMHNWEWFKIPVKVASDASNDPNGGGGTTSLDGFAILLKDCQWKRGGDGSYAFDFYQHDALQADVGVDETETSPLGGTRGMIMETT